jgi:hypothetical protein
MLVGRPVIGSVAVGMPFLPTNGPTPKFWCVVYFGVGGGAGTAKHRHGRVGTLKTVDRVGVAAGRIADHVDGELRIDRRPVRAPGRPRQRNPDEAALEQE